MMGSLSGMVNGASAMFVRDIYQNFLRPSCEQRELISASHLSSAVIVLIGFGVGLAATSINELWSWLMMGLTAGSLGPGLLRLYWWRTTAIGMATGLLAGGAAALCQRYFNPGMGEGMQFILMTLVSLGFGVVGSLLSKPTPESIVSHFYETTKPFGFWAPFRRRLSETTRKARTKEHRNDFLSAWIALVWQVCLFMIPMQFLTRNWVGLGFTVPLITLMSVGLYFFWWRCLPPGTEKIPDFPLTPASRSNAQ
jgi:SSS family solute:Na+ symporter